jgi:DNA-binding NtrC family response regulator
MSNLLIIEDEDIIRNALSKMLSSHGFTVSQASTIPEAETQYDLNDFDLIITDLRLPGPAGTEVISRVPDIPVIIMTSYASVQSAVDAMREGAVDYIPKPFDHSELVLRIERALNQQKLLKQNKALKNEVERHYPVAGMIGNCKVMLTVCETIKRVAPTNSSVLILGETGTGKELVAHALHVQSPRSNAPLIAVNCASIPKNLIESELFGHIKGAFTGAHKARAGLIESADGGTLFLDEIGELPGEAQSQLLRVLEDGQVRRVGATQSRQVNIRLVAATHRDLQQQVKQGLFREDLYFRLNVIQITLPPLRERGDDIEELSRHMLKRIGDELGKPELTLDRSAMDALSRHSWPGNVRELQNIIERAAILCDSDVITADVLGLVHVDTTLQESNLNDADLSLDDYFRAFVKRNQERMNETELAAKLGISRKSLWERRQRLNIPRQV